MSQNQNILKLTVPHFCFLLFKNISWKESKHLLELANYIGKQNPYMNETLVILPGSINYFS